VGGLARGSHGSRLAERPVARFPWFAGLAAALLAIEFARRRRRKADREIEPALHSGRGAAAAVLVMVGAATLLALTPRAGIAQSAWARGDRALKAGRYGAAESLYTRRLEARAPDDVRVNRATARALRGPAAAQAPAPPGAPPVPAPEDELRQLSANDTRAGRAAGYNVGTLLGERGEFDPALAALRQVLERDPHDADARWNYEYLVRRKREQANSNRNPQQSPSQPRPGGGSGANPQPRPASQGQTPPPSRSPARRPRVRRPPTSSARAG